MWHTFPQSFPKHKDILGPLSADLMCKYVDKMIGAI